MNKVGSFVGLVAVAMMTFACGGTVSVDPGGAANTGGAGGSSEPNPPSACPSGFTTDAEIMAIVGQPCATNGVNCASNEGGCGGCDVTCVKGVWKPSQSELCVYLQNC